LAEAARRRDPDATAWSATESVDDIAGEAVTHAPRRHPAAIQHAQSVLGGHPEAAFVQCQRADICARQPFVRRDEVGAAGMPPRDPRATEPEPDGAVGVLE